MKSCNIKYKYMRIDILYKNKNLIIDILYKRMTKYES